jgi:hypothetical protein
MATVDLIKVYLGVLNAQTGWAVEASIYVQNSYNVNPRTGTLKQKVSVAISEVKTIGAGGPDWVEFTFTSAEITDNNWVGVLITTTAGLAFAATNLCWYYASSFTTTGTSDSERYWKYSSGSWSDDTVNCGAYEMYCTGCDNNFTTGATTARRTFKESLMQGVRSYASALAPAVITAPGQPTTPYPANAAVSVSLNVSSLTWADGGNTDYFKVYVGDTSGSLTWIASTITSLPLVDYLATISYPFDYYNTLYWRVDAVNTVATTSGVEWSFTTLKLTPPSPTGYYTTTKQFYRLLPVTSTTSGWGSAPGIGIENYDYAFLTSTYFYNVINTNKKLIAAANSAIWYET